MKGLFILSVFFSALFSAHETSAQDTSSRFAVLISPALFVPVSVAVQGGVQWKLGKKWSLLAEAAYPVFHPNNAEYEEISHWRTSLELKWWPGKASSANRYFSLQAAYLYRQLKDKDQAYYYSKTQTFSYNDAVIKSPVLSTAVKLGVELPLGKRTFVDAFAGAGLRFISSSYSAKSVLVTSTEPPRQNLFKFDDAWVYNYTLMRLHGTAGLRFGVRL